MQVDQILFSSKAATLSGLLTDHFSRRGPLWNGTLSKIEVLYTEFYLCVIWECGADNVRPKMTMNCLEEEKGLWYNFKSIYWWLRKKAKTVLFFFFWNIKFLALAWLQNVYVCVLHKFLLCCSAILCYPRIPARKQNYFIGLAMLLIVLQLLLHEEDLWFMWDIASQFLFIYTNCGLFISNL